MWHVLNLLLDTKSMYRRLIFFYKKRYKRIKKSLKKRNKKNWIIILRKRQVSFQAWCPRILVLICHSTVIAVRNCRAQISQPMRTKSVEFKFKHPLYVVCFWDPHHWKTNLILVSFAKDPHLYSSFLINDKNSISPMLMIITFDMICL